MATRVPGVLGSFEEIDAATDAIHALRARGHGDLTVYSAAPNHELEEALAQPKSSVRLFTLVGGLMGCASGFGMTIWMSYDWPLIVGGKTIAAIPPYVVIAFELTILFGAIGTIFGLLFHSWKDAKPAPFAIGRVAVTLRVERSTIDAVPSPWFTTQRSPPAMARPTGCAPTLTRAITFPLEGESSVTVDPL